MLRRFLTLLFLIPSVGHTVELRNIEPLSLEAGTSFERRLSKEVKRSITGDVQFSLKDAPGWVKLKDDTLFGTAPNDLGPVVITFHAKEKGLATDAAVGRVVINVFAAPKLPAEINLGDIEERKKLEIDLKAKTQHPSKNRLAFQASSDLPTWLQLNANGTLTGTPERENVGRKFDFEVTVTGNDGGKTSTRVFGRVLKIPLPTKWKKKEFTLEAAKEDAPYHSTVNNPDWIENPEKARLRFKTLGDKPWFELSWDGSIRGMPHRDDVGKKTYEVEVEATVDEKTFTDVAKVTVNTDKINKPPKWNNSTVQLPGGTSNQKYDFKDLAKQVTELDQDKLKFELVPQSGPAWLKLDSEGRVQADLRPQYTGVHRWKVSVSDGVFRDIATVELAVDNHPPAWTEKSKTLPDIVESQPFQLDLKKLSEDPDHDPLTFEARRLPAFLKLNGDTLSGTPERDAVGVHPIRIRASDGHSSADLETTLKVLLKPYPPQVFAEKLTFKMRERTEQDINLADPRYVQDPNGDVLKFKWEAKPPPWAQLQESGSLKLSPQLQQVGKQEIRVAVSDGKFTTPMPIQVEVVRDPRPPAWDPQAISLHAKAREPFTGSVAKQVKDPDALPLTIRRSGGPKWLQVGPNDELGGTPPDSAVGPNVFSIVADNGLASATKEIQITVDFKNHPPEVRSEALRLELRERIPLEINLATSRYTQDMDEKDPRTFRSEKWPDWAVLNTSGALSLTPGFKHVGEHTLPFTVSDGIDTTKAELHVHVLRDARAPEWDSSEIVYDALSRDPFKEDLGKHVKDLDGIKIKYTKTSGPEWFKLTEDGILTANPTDQQIGDYKLRIVAKNDLKESSAKVTVKVTFKNNPPKWKQNVIELPSGRAKAFYSQDFNTHAEDMDTFQTLRFYKVSGPNWAVIDPAGKVFGTPADSDQGRNELQVRVEDGAGGQATATLKFKIDPANSAPMALNNGSLQLPDAYQNELMLYNLSPMFKDAQGDKLVFRKLYGPNWMRVNETGEVTGVPGADSFGQYNVVFEVDDGSSPIQVKAQGLVKQP